MRYRLSKFSKNVGIVCHLGAAAKGGYLSVCHLVAPAKGVYAFCHVSQRSQLSNQFSFNTVVGGVACIFSIILWVLLYIIENYNQYVSTKKIFK